MKINYTKKELIELCNLGEVTYDKWQNRDSYLAQQNLHIAKLTLQGGCDFKISIKEDDKKNGYATNEETIWIEIFYDNWENKEEWHTHYIPTKKRLEKSKNGDWY